MIERTGLGKKDAERASGEKKGEEGTMGDKQEGAYPEKGTKKIY